MAPVLNRRRFLAYSGAGAVALAGAGYGIDALVARARLTPLTPGTGVLVLLTLYGGNDGLNTVIPAGDPAYQSARPELAYAESDVLPLGDGLGLNPGLTGLKTLWTTSTWPSCAACRTPNPTTATSARWTSGRP